MKLIDLSYYLVYICTYIIVIPVIVGFYRFKSLSNTLRIFLLGLGVVLFLDLLLLFFSLRTTNTFLYIFAFVELVTLSYVYISYYSSITAKKTIGIGGTLIAVLLMVDALFISGIDSNGFSISITKLFIASIAIFYMSRLFKEEVESKLSDKPIFWISIGAIAYYLIGFFDIMQGPIISYSQNLYLQYYMVWSIVTIIMYLFYSTAFWKSK